VHVLRNALHGTKYRTSRPFRRKTAILRSSSPSDAASCAGSAKLALRNGRMCGGPVLNVQCLYWFVMGHAVAQLVEALCCKREGPSGRTMALGSTQRLTEMSTRNASWGVKAAGA
jgi:hypothetical protein